LFAEKKARASETPMCVVCKGEPNVAEIVIQQTEAGTGNFYEFIPDVYDAVCAGVEEVDNPFEDDKTQLQFSFEVPGYANEDGTVASKRAWANPVWNAKSKLWKWTSAITAATPQPGDPFRSSMVVGKACRVVMNADMNQKGEPVVKITDVLAAKNAVAAPPAGKKKGLVERVKAGEVNGVAVAPEEIPFEGALLCVVCKQPAFSYDEDGENAICVKHGGLPQ
jgi:hypothetical protein